MVVRVVSETEVAEEDGNGVMEIEFEEMEMVGLFG